MIATATSARIEWPNVESSANSDAWIAQHHVALRAMRPRVLVLNFVNAKRGSDLRPFVDEVIAGIREGSRHGYEDPEAPPFLFFEIAKIVDIVRRSACCRLDVQEQL